MEDTLVVHVLERGEHADAQKARLGHPDRPDVLEMVLDRRRGHEFEDEVRPRWRLARANKSDQVRM